MLIRNRKRGALYTTRRLRKEPGPTAASWLELIVSWLNNRRRTKSPLYVPDAVGIAVRYEPSVLQCSLPCRHCLLCLRGVGHSRGQAYNALLSHIYIYTLFTCRAQAGASVGADQTQLEARLQQALLQQARLTMLPSLWALNVCALRPSACSCGGCLRQCIVPLL